MNLKNFEQHVEDKILSRGRSYTDAVMELQQVDEGEPPLGTRLGRLIS